MSTVTTAVFKTASGEYLGTLMGMWLRRYWWIPVLPPAILAGLGAALHDWRFTLIALMFVFIIIPMGMSWLYTNYMLTPDARQAILPKRVEIDKGKGLRLIYEPQPPVDDGDEPRQIPDEFVKASDVSRTDFGKTAVIYLLRTRGIRFILVPYSSLPDGVTRDSLCV